MPKIEDDAVDAMDATEAEPEESLGDEEGGGAAESPLDQLAAERGLTTEQARDLLDRASDEDAKEKQARGNEEREAFFNQEYRRRGGELFAGELRRKDFAARALEHIRQSHPDLLPARAAEEVEDDPVAALNRSHKAEMQALRRELGEQIDQLRGFARQTTAIGHEQQTAATLQAFVDQLPATEQRFEDDLVSELREAYDQNKDRFGSQRDVTQFLRSKLSRYKRAAGIEEKPRTTTPPRGSSGRPGVAPPRKRLPDLSPQGIGAAALAWAKAQGLDDGTMED